ETALRLLLANAEKYTPEDHIKEICKYLNPELGMSGIMEGFLADFRKRLGLGSKEKAFAAEKGCSDTRLGLHFMKSTASWKKSMHVTPAISSIGNWLLNCLRRSLS